MSEQGRNQSPKLQDPHRKAVWKGPCDTLPPDYWAEGGDSFVPNQLVVTGTREDIKTVIGRLPAGRQDQLQPQSEEINLGSLRALSTDGRGPRSEQSDQEPNVRLRFGDELPESLASQIYRLPDGVKIESVITDFYDAAIAERRQVYAEPNYLIGSTDSVAGHPGCIEGGPVGPLGGAAPQGRFWNQWALKEPQGGITRHNLEAEAEGRGIRVALFDTSPFHRPGFWHIPWIKEGLDLCVSHPRKLVDIRPEGGGKADYSDHGLFVASMVYAVASSSEIHLIRVLNADNLGDLGTLIKALCDFVVLDSKRREGKLDRTVLNLSLGLVVDPSDNPPWLSLIKEKIQQLHAELGLPISPPLGGTPPVVYLETVLGAAWNAGATIVAASGNESDRIAPAKAAHIPAAYKFVIGVAGHNQAQNRSSFSNKGDIAGPGGDGPPTKQLPQNSPAMNPHNWLIGLSLHSGHQPTGGYMYWMGTSFAAPLVAGYAARGLSNGWLPCQVRPGLKATAGPAVPAGDLSLGDGCAKMP